MSCVSLLHSNKDLKDTMKDEVNRIAENKERAQKGEPQIPGAAVREGAADISPSGERPLVYSSAALSYCAEACN